MRWILTGRWCSLIAIAIMGVVFAAEAVLADEVLFCTDTDAIGFSWKTTQGSPSAFTQERFTIKVVSDTDRIITRMVGDTAGSSTAYKCRPSYPPDWSTITCDDGAGVIPWIFYGTGFTRTFLLGTPVGGTDRNITVAYGVCTKF